MGIYAIGDIHGHSDKLDNLMARLPLTAQDKLVFLGDYVDRGTDSKGVISLLIQIAKRYDTICLLGNHDHMFVDYVRGCQTYDIGLWMAPQNAGVTCLRSYGDPEAEPGQVAIPAEHREFLDKLHYYHVEDGFVFVHGGLKPGVPLKDNKYKDFLWPRSAFYTSQYRWPEGRVVFGHTVFPEPLVEENKIGIDTNCARGGPLTAVRLPDVEFFQV